MTPARDDADIRFDDADLADFIRGLAFSVILSIPLWVLILNAVRHVL